MCDRPAPGLEHRAPDHEGGGIVSGAPPKRYEVRARITGPGRSEATCKASRIAFDSSTGQSPDLPGPAELLASAFAACLLKNVERYSEILPFRHAGASVRVSAERQDRPPRFTRIRYELSVITDEEPHRVELLHKNLRKWGTVYNTLAAACDVDGALIAVTPDGRAGPEANA
jgi:uncharacterized OsmC-like protein